MTTTYDVLLDGNTIEAGIESAYRARESALDVAAKYEATATLVRRNGDGPPEVVESFAGAMPVEFSIPGKAAEAIQLDEIIYRYVAREKGEPIVIERQRIGRGYRWNVRTTVRVAKIAAWDLFERGEGGGYDQPAAWATACRKAAPGVFDAVAEYEIETDDPEATAALDWLRKNFGYAGRS